MQGLPWPRFEVLDTAKLARRVVTRDDAPNCKLSSLARLFNASTTPNHRALSDARATVDVLHGLMERLGNLGRAHAGGALDLLLAGVHGAAQEAPPRRAAPPRSGRLPVPRQPATRCSTSARRRTCAPASAPTSPPARPAPGWARWSGWPTSVEGITCATPLEAEVRELRLIAEHKPRYNRRSKFPERVNWVKLTVEPWPRLSLVKQVLDDGADYLGPVPLPLVRRGRDGGSARELPDPSVQRPAATATRAAARASWPRWVVACRPCDGSANADDYTVTVDALRRSLDASPEVVTAAIRRRMARCAPTERFEEATSHRNRMTSFIRAAARSQRLRALTRCAEIVAARRDDQGRWEVHVVRHGRLAAAGVIPSGAQCSRLDRPARSRAPTP